MTRDHPWLDGPLPKRAEELFAGVERVPMCRITVSSSWHDPVRCALAEGHPGKHSWASLPAHDPMARGDALAARVQELEEALLMLVAQAQDILDVLASGSEPWASTGYGYEHMGDFTRDVKPLCEALVALTPEEPKP